MPLTHRSHPPSISSQPSDISGDTRSSGLTGTRSDRTRSGGRNVDENRRLYQRHSDTTREPSRDDSYNRDLMSRSRRYKDAKSNEMKDRGSERNQYKNWEQSFERHSGKDSYEATDCKHDNEQYENTNRNCARNENGNRGAHHEAKSAEKRGKTYKKHNYLDTKLCEDYSLRRVTSKGCRLKDDGDKSKQQFEMEPLQKAGVLTEELRQTYSQKSKDKDRSQDGNRVNNEGSQKKLKKSKDDVEGGVSVELQGSKSKKDEKSEGSKKKNQLMYDTKYSSGHSRASGSYPVRPTASRDTSYNKSDPQKNEDQPNQNSLNRSVTVRRAGTILNARESKLAADFVMEEPSLLRAAAYVAAIISALDALCGILGGAFILYNRKDYIATDAGNTERNYKDYTMYTYLTIHSLSFVSSGVFLLANKKGHINSIIFWISIQISISIVFTAGIILFLTQELRQNDVTELFEGKKLLVMLYFSSLLLTLTIVRVINILIAWRRYKKLIWLPRRGPCVSGAKSHPITRLGVTETGQLSLEDRYSVVLDELRASNVEISQRQHKDTRKDTSYRNHEKASHHSKNGGVFASELNYADHLRSEKNGPTAQTTLGSIRVGTSNDGAAVSAPMQVVVEVHNPSKDGSVRSATSQSSGGTISTFTSQSIPRQFSLADIDVAKTITTRGCINKSTATNGRLTNRPSYENSSTREHPSMEYFCEYCSRDERSYDLDRPQTDKQSEDYASQWSCPRLVQARRSRLEPWNNSSHFIQDEREKSALKLCKSPPTGAVPAVGNPEQWARFRGRNLHHYGADSTGELRKLAFTELEPKPDY
ncbi:uncharacterized protein LOC111249278 [Varroa destructor]|uniref:Uncharacterized protein n=1 Tax=Varroa destructor TaxID=109461 RepID=A0A7M7JXM3_VARDE|nr:uncharacterized protein LOC111249278 [Varroa destructor]